MIFFATVRGGCFFSFCVVALFCLVSSRVVWRRTVLCFSEGLLLFFDWLSHGSAECWLFCCILGFIFVVNFMFIMCILPYHAIVLIITQEVSKWNCYCKLITLSNTLMMHVTPFYICCPSKQRRYFPGSFMYNHNEA